MNELIEIAKLIQDRTTKERTVKNPSIAGGTVVHNGQTYYAWIVNFETESNTRYLRDITGTIRDTTLNGTVHTLIEYGKNSIAISKNKPLAQKILRQYGRDIRVGTRSFDIHSSYIWGVDVRGPIKIGTILQNKWQHYYLKNLLSMAAKVEDAQKTGDKEATQNAVKRLEEELARIEQMPQAAYRFVREQAELRLNPILDEVQDEAKFAHIYDGVTEIIDGGPGTGKTTTLIQRLKYLITPDDIDEQRIENGLQPLTKAQRDLLNSDVNTWIFFSPTPLLRKYLRTNMLSEGLHNADSQTFVWSEYLQKILRDNYMLAGDDLPFVFKKRPLRGRKIYKCKTLSILKKFEGFYLKSLVAQIGKTTKVDYSLLPWKKVAMEIVAICNEIKVSHSFTDLVRGLLRLERLRTTISIETPTIKQIADERNELLNNRSARIFYRIKKNELLLNELLGMVVSWTTPEEGDNEMADDEFQIPAASQPLESKLNTYLKNILNNLALQQYDSKLQLKGRQSLIFQKISSLIGEDDYADLAEYAYFHKHFMPVVGNLESFLFGRISTAYKNFRRDALKQKKERDWYLSTLQVIIGDYDNKLLHPHEQALLLGFINNLILTVRKVSRQRYETLSYKYAVGFKSCCRPIIGIDEATDYSIFDYYAIASLRNPGFSSITLTGDIMQCLNESGITDWATLKNNLIFPKLDTKRLTISYRQSPKLLKLADHLYQATTGQPSPYKGLQEDNEDIPQPLWYVAENEEDKAEWIVRRILEVKNAYQKVPSIAIFVSDADKVVPLKKAMEEIELLEDAGIEIVNCSDGLVDATRDSVRIFPIDMVKGMEFEVVFFHDIETITNIKMIDRYLYIGLSRASFYMGVTSGNTLDSTVLEVKPLFKTNENWSPKASLSR